MCLRQNVLHADVEKVIVRQGCKTHESIENMEIFKHQETREEVES